MHSSSGVETCTSTNLPNGSTNPRAACRDSSYGDTADTRTTAPAWTRRDDTQAMRAMFVSRSRREKPRPRDRWERTASPSSRSTTSPRRSSCGAKVLAIDVFPAPGRPVNQTTNPFVLSAVLRQSAVRRGVMERCGDPPDPPAVAEERGGAAPRSNARPSVGPLSDRSSGEAISSPR